MAVTEALGAGAFFGAVFAARVAWRDLEAPVRMVAAAACGLGALLRGVPLAPTPAGLVAAFDIVTLAVLAASGLRFATARAWVATASVVTVFAADAAWWYLDAPVAVALVARLVAVGALVRAAGRDVFVEGTAVAASATVVAITTGFVLTRTVGAVSLVAALAGLAGGAAVVVLLHARPFLGTFVLRAGDVVAKRYRVTRPLGRGASAEVHLARDRETRELVAVKLLTNGAAAPLVDREIAAVASVASPRVVALRQVVEDRRGVCLVMEYVDGGTLADVIKRDRAFPLERVAVLGADLLSGLAAAHAAGVVHRDVKPSNVLLSRDGHAKLADFNIARVPDADATLGVETGSGLIVGTLRYASPELASGAPATPASDVWAAAATLYEAATGKPYVTFGANESVAAVRTRLATLGPFDANRDAPPELAPWFALALHPDPHERYRDGGTAAAAWDAVVGSVRQVLADQDG